MSRYSICIFLGGLVMTLSSCANQIPLTGGEKDIIPPRIDTSSSSPNFQLHFEPEEIYIEFDEFINFKNPSQQVIISPPLEYGLDIDHRGEKIKIKFDEREIFKKEATYIINFGESISDYTENNILKNYSFVYSTGDYIDSLSIRGNVVDAKTNEPIENMTVMLYDVLEDSIVFKERPFYFAKTEEDGTFELNNLRSDTFKIVVLEDLNLNYLYEENAESFGYLKEPIILTDTTSEGLTVKVFKSKTYPRYQEGRVVHDGLFSLTFDQELSHNPSEVIDKNLRTLAEVQGKSVNYFIRDIDEYPMFFSISLDSLVDTISIRLPATKDQKSLPELKIIDSNVDKVSGLHPLDTLELEFNLPIDSINYELINLEANQILQDSHHLRQLMIVNDWIEGEDYILTFDSNSIIDFYGRSIDSSSFKFEIGRRNSFSGIDLTLENHADGINYVVTLLKTDKQLKKWPEVNSNIKSLIVNKLPPGEYVINIIEDVNNNGRWDPGKYLEKKYSENIFEVKLEPLKENWTLEYTVDFVILSNERK